MLLTLLLIALMGCSDEQPEDPKKDDSRCPASSGMCLRFKLYYQGGTDCTSCSQFGSTISVQVLDAAGEVVKERSGESWDYYNPEGENRPFCMSELPGEVPLALKVTVYCPQTVGIGGAPCGPRTFQALDNARLTLPCNDYNGEYAVPLYAS